MLFERPLLYQSPSVFMNVPSFPYRKQKKKEKEFDKTSTSSAILLRWISAFHSSIMIVVQ